MVFLKTIKTNKTMKKIIISIIGALCGIASVSAESWQTYDAMLKDTITITFQNDSVMFIDSRNGEEGDEYRYKRIGNHIVYRDLIYNDCYEFTIANKSDDRMVVVMDKDKATFNRIKNYIFK